MNLNLSSGLKWVNQESSSFKSDFLKWINKLHLMLYNTENLLKSSERVPVQIQQKQTLE